MLFYVISQQGFSFKQGYQCSCYAVRIAFSQELLSQAKLILSTATADGMSNSPFTVAWLLHRSAENSCCARLRSSIASRSVQEVYQRLLNDGWLNYKARMP